MIEISELETFNWKAAIRGMRNPKKSWAKSDSKYKHLVSLGSNDLKLMQTLIKAGSDHRKFMRQIFISMDINAPLYWWKEFETYKVGTVANSESTMHMIHTEEIVSDMFSFDELDEDEVISSLENLRLKYIETKDKKYWRKLIQKLPSSFNQKRTISMNYENMINMYYARKNHKLTEWVEFCDYMINTIPYGYELMKCRPEIKIEI